MGLIFSRFYDKPSTRDTLEKIEQELQNIEERRWDKIKREQFIVQILSFIPITILIANVCILLYPSDSSWRDKLILSIPIVILNLVLWLCRKIVQWYSKWSLDNEEARLRKLQKEKKKILEMVCETESYKVATELLEKYDPKQLRRREKATERPHSPMNTTLTKLTASPIRSPQQQLQQVQQHQMQSPMSFHNQSINFPIHTPQMAVPAPPPPTPISKPSNQSIIAPATQPKAPKPTSTNLHNNSMVVPATSVATTAPVAASSVQGRPVRPILSKDRSIFERVVDWVVADGPENRFALICRYCYGHNGMSLAEEYETINFRCCYCYNLNTATNKRTQVHDQLQPEREKSDSNSKSNQAVVSSKEIDEDNDDNNISSIQPPKEERKNKKGKKKQSKLEESIPEETSKTDYIIDDKDDNEALSKVSEVSKEACGEETQSSEIDSDTKKSSKQNGVAEVESK